MLYPYVLEPRNQGWKEMARPLAKEIREAIVSAYERDAGTIPEVAVMFNINPRTVSKRLSG